MGPFLTEEMSACHCDNRVMATLAFPGATAEQKPGARYWANADRTLRCSALLCMTVDHCGLGLQSLSGASRRCSTRYGAAPSETGLAELFGLPTHNA